MLTTTTTKMVDSITRIITINTIVGPMMSMNCRPKRPIRRNRLPMSMLAWFEVNRPTHKLSGFGLVNCSRTCKVDDWSLHRRRRQQPPIQPTETITRTTRHDACGMDGSWYHTISLDLEFACRLDTSRIASRTLVVGDTIALWYNESGQCQQSIVVVVVSTAIGLAIGICLGF